MKRIVILHESVDPQWRWVAHHMPEFAWSFVNAPPARGGIWNRVRRQLAGLRAARLAREADLVLTFGAGLTSVLEIARKLLRVTTPHCSYFLNFDRLPTGSTLRRQAPLFRGVERIVVSSTMERALYAGHFGIDPARIDVLLWGVNAPDVSDKHLAKGDYVCAVGGNSRDYAMLMEVARARIDMPFVLVVRPANLEGLDIPSNVTTFTNIPFADAMAIVRDAKVMALPLVATDTPCGHVTIVAAFYLGTPIVVTDSTGIEDYVQDGVTGLVAATGSSVDFGAAIDRLWSEPELAARLGQAGADFANAQCTEANYPAHVRKMLNEVR